jgi:hypothetical protein
MGCRTSLITTAQVPVVAGLLALKGSVVRSK